MFRIKRVSTCIYGTMYDRYIYIYIYIYILAEYVALWGKPELAVHGVKERRAAASSGINGKRVTIWLVVAFALTT